MTHPTPMKKFAPYLIFIAAMLWATDTPFRAHLTQGLSSNFIVLVEHFFDCLIAVPLIIMNWSAIKTLTAKQWVAVIIIAVGGSALASIAFTQAFHYVNPSVAILLQKLQPLIAISLAAAILKEHTGKYFWLWACFALLGAYIISFPNFRPEVFPGEKLNPNVIGVSLALTAAVLWGASTVLGKYVLNKSDFKVMTSLRFGLAFVFLLILNFSEHSIPPLKTITGIDWLFLFIIAITSGVVSLFIYYKGLKNTKASVATLAELGFPMAAVVVNWISFKLHWISIDTSLMPMQLIGIALLLFAVYKLADVNDENEVIGEVIIP